MKISENFDTFVESMIKRHTDGEITDAEFIEAYNRGYNEAESELVSEIAELVSEGVIDKKEAFEYAAYMDNGYPETETSIFEMVEDNLLRMDEEATMEADSKVASGQLTDAEKEKAIREYQKRKKKASFKEKLKKVGKGVGAAAITGAAIYAGYKGGQALAKSADNGAIKKFTTDAKEKYKDYKMDSAEKKAEKKHQKEEEAFMNLGRHNMRAGNKDYDDLYNRYDAEDKSMKKAEEDAYKSAKNDYERAQVRTNFNEYRINNAQARQEELNDRMGMKYKKATGMKQVTPVMKDGKIDVKATKEKQYKANQKYRDYRKAYRDSVIKDEAKRAKEFDTMDRYRQAETAKALRPIHKKVGDAIANVPMKVANAVDNFNAGLANMAKDDVNRRYKDSYKNI